MLIPAGVPVPVPVPVSVPVDDREAAVQALVARAQAGDRDAYGLLWERFQPKVAAFLAYHLNGRADLAEDLAADVFRKVLEKLDTYQPTPEVPFTAWLYRIARNRLVDWLRVETGRHQTVSLDARDRPRGPGRAHHALVGSVGDADAWLARQGVDPEPDPAGALDRQALLAAGLDRLTADQRTAIRLRWLEDRSIEDTARRMGRAEDAVKQLQLRGFRNLRRHFAAAGFPTLHEVLA